MVFVKRLSTDCRPKGVRARKVRIRFCRRQTRAMRCVTPTVLYTKVDALYDKLSTVVIPTQLTTFSLRPMTIEVPWRKAEKSAEFKVWDKVPLFWKVSKFTYKLTQCRIRWRYNEGRLGLCQKQCTLSSSSCTKTMCSLMSVSGCEKPGPMLVFWRVLLHKFLPH